MVMVDPYETRRDDVRVVCLARQYVAELAGVVPPAATVWPAAECPGAAAAPDLKGSEPQAQKDMPCTAEPAEEEPSSAQRVQGDEGHGG
ncbi:hypothetical protein Baya_16699 [Bagarius yarrelli]|uniref:Uncharacterized protein n=1 Tax=Bagarius yarrelli TaxID=175774 RepID=A0A556VW97_BAGYA|nr:hypothetical protein Baya_16699 [Bagarius yarrelli]